MTPLELILIVILVVLTVIFGYHAIPILNARRKGLIIFVGDDGRILFINPKRVSYSKQDIEAKIGGEERRIKFDRNSTYIHSKHKFPVWLLVSGSMKALDILNGNQNNMDWAWVSLLLDEAKIQGMEKAGVIKDDKKAEFKWIIYAGAGMLVLAIVLNIVKTFMK